MVTDEFLDCLLRSYARWLGRSLLTTGSSVTADRQALFSAPFVVVAHGTEPDPVLCYGNQAALTLWETDLATFVTMPSRLTAEPLHRDKRARLLERTTRDGYVDDYRGIRISSTGKRFLIEQAIVWNIVDNDARYLGQAATFSTWTMLPEKA